FISSRRRHTRSDRDWSSDVCSSDLYYRSIAWQYQQRGKNSEWVKVAEESLHVPFYIDDGSGKLLVDPSGAEMDLHCDLHEEYNQIGRASCRERGEVWRMAREV